MSTRALLARDALRRAIADAPPAPAAWLSVARRSAVVVVIFLAGIATSELDLAVLACFGALQVGLLEAALPLRKLIRLMVLLVLATSAAVFIAMLVGGTWWMVAYIAVLAYVFGSTAGLGPVFATVGITVLALAVIFSGMPQTPQVALQHAGWVAAGAAIQGLAAIALWRVERQAFVRRALAIKLRSDVRLLRNPFVDPEALVRTHAASDTLATVLAEAHLPADEDARVRQAFSAAVETTRAIVAWLVVRAPGVEARIGLMQPLNRTARMLETGRARGVPPSPACVGDSMAGEVLLRDVGELFAATRSVIEGEPAEREPIEPNSSNARELHSLARRTTEHVPVTFADLRAALAPRGRAARHGWRMVVGLTIAEVITLVVPVGHSFWLPLTVVFTLKPDWSFTLIRGLNRTLGNLGAVVMLPALMIALSAMGLGAQGTDMLMVLPLACLVAVTYRWFFGNYLVASFGLAGSILLLDFTLAPDDDLFITRIVAALLGALLSLAVSLAMPSWRSGDGPGQVKAFETALIGLRRSVDVKAAPDELDAGIIASRNALQELEPTAAGSLLEPRPHGDPTQLAIILAAGARLLSELIALAYLSIAPVEESTGSAVLSAGDRELPVQQAAEDFDRAVTAYRASIAT